MIEAEWLVSEEPRKMDEYLFILQTGKTGGLFGELRNRGWKAIPPRKWRLLACSFCHQFSEHTEWQLLRHAVELTEQSSNQPELYGNEAEASILVVNTAYALFASLEKTFPAAGTWTEKKVEEMEHTYWLLRTAWCHLLHDIFGNPFRPVTLNQSWLTSAVLSLANGIYEEKAFDRMPILADALQDAGCDNEEMLNHCRQPGVHVRGCWVVDLLTNRK